MLSIETYMQQLIEQLKAHFGARLAYVGLQGSYLRGEATAESDIDVMAVIDGLSVQDMDAYREVLEAVPCEAPTCGFICSREDLAAWNPLEIGHLVHTTKDYVGVLREMVPAYTMADVRNFVKMSLNGMYHALCHRYIHALRSVSEDSLPFDYKGVFFILQNLYYLTHGEFIVTHAALLERLEGKDRAVLARAQALHAGSDTQFQEDFELLFSWCQETLHSIA